MAKPKLVHLSRSEVLELVYGKLHLIQGECEEVTREESRPTQRELLDILRRFKRIAIEARRAASLIETHTHVASAGHCTHCGKTYEEHDSDEERQAKREGGLLPKTLAKEGGVQGPRCMALQRLFDSLELETYQPLPMLEGA